MEHLLTDRRQEGGQCVWNGTKMNNYENNTMLNTSI